MLIFILFASCKSDNSTDTDTGSDLQLIRFDNLLMGMDTTNIEKEFEQLYSNYPAFSDVYFSNVLALPGYQKDMPLFFNNLKAFITDDRIKEVHKLIQGIYGDFSEEKTAFQKLFKNAASFFPEKSDPVIYTYLSEFTLQRFIFDDNGKDGLAIGLDLFLGEDFDYIRLEQGSNTFANYLTRTYNKEHLIRKVAESWIEDQLGLQSGNRLVDQMTYNGMKLYILENITAVHDTILMEYTGEQMDWINANEKELWAFYFENDWFYTTDQYVIKRLVSPGPNSSALGMPAAAPGQTGNFVGWKIVKAYMRNNPETSVEMFNQLDAQQILEKSKYKPGLN